MIEEISLQLTIEEDARNLSLLKQKYKDNTPEILVYRINTFVAEIREPYSIEQKLYIYNDNILSCGFGNVGCFIAENDLSLDELKSFLVEYINGLIGGNSYELICKGHPLFHDYDFHYSFMQGISFNRKFCGRWNSVLKEIKLVSAQKGNSFYHEDEVIDLSSWQPENPRDFELYMCFHLIFNDGTVQPIYKTWATRNKVIESYRRYVTETKKRIILMYPFYIAEEYNLAFWDNYLNEYYFPVTIKEEAFVKYYVVGFDIPNYRAYMSQKISPFETTYVFNGKVEFFDGVEEYTRDWLK